MKIAIVQPRVSYYTGGGEKLSLVLSRLLSSRGYRVIVYTTKVPKTRQSPLYKNQLSLNERNLILKEFELPEKYKSLLFKEAGEDRNRWDTESLLFNQLIFNDLKKVKPDIVISYYILDGVFRPLGIPALLYLIGYPSDQLEIRKSFLRFFDATISISNNVRRRWGDNLDEVRQNFTLNSGVDMPNDSKEIKTNYPFNIAFAGRLVERKGLATLIESHAQLTRLHPETHLWIIGDGPQKKMLRSLVDNLGLNKNITFTGIVSDPSDYFRMADICVFPSYEKEGLMGVVLEAMSVGRPVVTTKNNGSEDVIKNGTTGLLIDPKSTKQLTNAILILMEDGKMRETIGNNAKRYAAEKLTWEIFIKKFESIIKRVAK